MNPPTDPRPKAERFQQFLHALAQFERLVFQKANDEARLAACKDALGAYIAYSEDGPLSSATDEGCADQIYTRFAAAITSWVAQHESALNYATLHFLLLHKQAISAVFAASGFRATTHLIDALSERQDGQRHLPAAKLPLVAACVRLDDLPPPLLQHIFQQPARLSVPLLLAFLSERQILSRQGEHNRTEILARAKLFADAMLPPCDLDVVARILARGWMYCSYAVTAERHAIKRGLNQFVRRNLLRPWLEQPLPSRPLRRKPRLLVIHEHWTHHHAMYRCFAPLIAELRPHFELVSLSPKARTTREAVQGFDDALVFTDVRFESIVEQILHIAPDTIYYPSVGMSPIVILLANLRLAPVQFASLGHAGTHHLEDTLDFICEFGLRPEHQAYFSERLLTALPRAVFHPHPGLPSTLPRKTRTGPAVRIGIHAKVMKLNHVIIDILIAARRQSRFPTEIHFFPGERGEAYDGLRKALQLYIPDAVVHPPYPYPKFLEQLAECDLFLQTYPFGATNSMVDCLLLHKPYVAIREPSLCPDNYKFFIEQVCPENLVDNPEAATERVVTLINDPNARDGIASRMRQIEIEKLLFKPVALEQGAKAVAEEVLTLLARGPMTSNQNGGDDVRVGFVSPAVR